MLARVKSILFRPDDLVSLRNEVPAAAAALFIECAVLDGGYDVSERRKIARLLAERFDLSADGLVRRVAGLLHVPDKEAGMARKKALECLDIIPTEA